MTIWTVDHFHSRRLFDLPEWFSACTKQLYVQSHVPIPASCRANWRARVCVGLRVINPLPDCSAWTRTQRENDEPKERCPAIAHATVAVRLEQHSIGSRDRGEEHRWPQPVPDLRWR